MRALLRVAICVALISGASVGAQSLPQRRPMLSREIRSLNEADTFGYPLAVPDKIELVNLLLARDVDQLEHIVSGYEQAAEADFRYEDWVDAAMEAFSVPAPSFDGPLSEWVEVRPRSAVARLARAVYRERLAWVSRGGAIARETSGTQFTGMVMYARLAIADAQRAVELNPRMMLGYATLIELYMLVGARAEREQTFHKAVKIQPRSYALRSAYMHSLLPMWSGSYEAMEAFAGESEALADANPRLRVLRATIFKHQAFDLPNSEGAARRAMLTRALTLGAHGQHYRDLASEEERAGHHQQALKQYVNAYTRFPQHAPVMRDLARVLMTLNRLDEAEEFLDAADAFDIAGEEKEGRKSMRADLLVRKGMALAEKGNVAGGLDALRDAQKNRPQPGQSHYLQGMVYLKARQKGQALAEFNAAVDQNPRDIESIKQIDRILSSQKRWDAIIPYWDRYLQLEPKSAEGYLERGGTHYHRGDRAASRADAKRACDLGDDQGCQRLKHFFDE